MKKLTHFSLFSGIGGIDLAAEWAGFKTVGQCEFADYPIKVLEKHWPHIPRWRDIRDVTAESFKERTGQQRVTLLSGGFPCQPHSVGGKRKSSSDERDLWPELRRVVGEIRPRWFLGENVRGLLSSEDGRFFGRVLSDMATLGYDVGWCCYGANRVGAIHKRERVFIIAHSYGERWIGMDKKQQKERSTLNMSLFEAWQNDSFDLLFNVEGFFSNPISGVCRNDDGLSEGVDRLQCLGNAVVPQQVYPILKAIADIENNN